MANVKEKKELIKNFKEIIDDLMDNYEQYTAEEKAKFLGYMEYQLGTVEPEINREELKEVFLGIYANPVVGKMNL